MRDQELDVGLHLSEDVLVQSGCLSIGRRHGRHGGAANANACVCLEKRLGEDTKVVENVDRIYIARMWHHDGFDHGLRVTRMCYISGGCINSRSKISTNDGQGSPSCAMCSDCDAENGVCASRRPSQYESLRLHACHRH